MMQRTIKHTLCAIIVSSSMNVWGMDGGKKIGAAGSVIRPIDISGASSSAPGSPPRMNRRGSAHDASHDLRKALAILTLRQDSLNNDQQALPSPSGNSLHNFGPDTPKSSDEKTSGSTPKTPETPVTPLGYILSSVGSIVIDHHLKEQILEDGSVMQRVRVFPREIFSRNSGEVEPTDYGTIVLKLNPTARTCILDHVEVNPKINVSADLKTSITQDLELRAIALAAERQKELLEAENN